MSTDAEALKFAIRDIRFADGTSVVLGEGAVLVIVGPNNSGKSTALRELDHELRRYRPRRFVIDQATTFREATESQMEEWLRDRFLESTPGHPGLYNVGSQNLTVATALKQFEGNLFDIGDGFWAVIGTEERLGVIQPRDSIDVVSQRAAWPLQQFLIEDELISVFNRYFQDAFGVGVVLRAGGPKLYLHLGECPLAPDEDRLSRSYQERLSRLPNLHEQGDGMRSFAGCVLTVVAGRHRVYLIDEPEAFLHPPQARVIGRLLASQKSKNQQLVIATHSSDVLRGLLDDPSRAVNIVRLSRSATAVHARVLTQVDLERAWSDPILRFSNVLDGIFHERVVICEGDADCRFYSAILDTVTAGRPHDTLFCSSGGKDRVRTVARAFVSLGIPTSIILDFDALRNDQPLRGIVEAVAGDWSAFQADWRLLNSTLKQKAPPLSLNQVRDQIDSIIDGVDGQSLTDAAADQIKEALKQSSAWTAAKSAGRNAIPNGQPTEALERLLRSLSSLGIFLVENGALESFDRSCGEHGPKWVAQVLQKDLHASEFRDARSFIERIVRSWS